MSRKSVIHLVPVPTARGDASEVRYRLLMAALGAGDELIPLSTSSDPQPSDAEQQAHKPTQPEAAAAAADSGEAVPELAAGDHANVGAIEDHPRPLSLVRPHTPPSLPQHAVVNEPRAQSTTTTLQPRPLKPR